MRLLPIYLMNFVLVTRQRATVGLAWVSSSSAFKPHHHQRLFQTSSTRLFSSSAKTPSTSSSSSTDNDASLNGLCEEVLERREFGGLEYWNTADCNTFRVMFVLGGPGAGKGTQSALMEEHYPVVHLSVGELLRDEQKEEASPHAALIDDCLTNGRIVPVEISLSLLQRRMVTKAQALGTQLLFLVDGFPRNADNLSGWCREMTDVSVLQHVLVYTCPLSVLQDRILKRAESSGRSDDNVASLARRFETFTRETVPIVQQLRRVSEQANNGLWSVTDISAEASVEEVWESTQQVLDKLILNNVLSANQALLEAAAEGDLMRYQQLCDPLWFDSLSESACLAVMQQQEGDRFPVGDLREAEVNVVSGKQVSLSYDRSLGQEWIRETRIWTHQGVLGWRNVHFSRGSAYDDDDDKQETVDEE